MQKISRKPFPNKKIYCHLYLARHGETDWNKKGLVQGHSNNLINKTGQKQIKELAKKLKKINFEAIYSSDLLRAKQTAEIIAQELKLPIIVNSSLRERNFGPFEGKPEVFLDFWRKKIKYGVNKLTIKEKKLIKSVKEGIESDENMMKRFIPLLKKISRSYLGKNVLIITHGGILRVFLIKLGFFKDEEDSFNFQIKNGALVKILSDGVEFFVKEAFGIERM